MCNQVLLSIVRYLPTHALNSLQTEALVIYVPLDRNTLTSQPWR